MKKKIVISIAGIFLAIFLFITSGVTLLLLVISELASQNGSYDISMDGLPPFITQEMVVTILEEQESTGYPASVALAQIIAESGFGLYGPGGEYGQGLSQLAYDYKNLFGMKAPAGNDIPIGVVNMQTGEEYGGENVTITAGFLVFRNYRECIQYRSTLITSVYSDLVGGVTDPDKFARKLGSRWATSSSYGDNLVQHMRTYDLYRFNNMSKNDLDDIPEISGSGSKGQRKLVALALQQDNFGCGQGWCQKWVAVIYQKAGQSSFQSRACATEAANDWLISKSKKNIPIGATVYGTHSYGNVPCGNHDAGHVGIYVGKGMVASNEGPITIKPIDEWISVYGWRGWGWNGGEDFSKR